jgi:hypothetical protein
MAVGLASVDEKPAGTEDHVYEYVPEPPPAFALSCTLSPAQIVPGVTAGDAVRASPVTVTVTASEAEHPVAFIVAVKTKVAVDVRLTVWGSSTSGLTSSEAGVQLYEKGPVPVTVPLRVVLVPLGMLILLPAFTPGRGLTVTVTGSDSGLSHPAALLTLTV